MDRVHLQAFQLPADQEAQHSLLAPQDMPQGLVAFAVWVQVSQVLVVVVVDRLFAGEGHSAWVLDLGVPDLVWVPVTLVGLDLVVLDLVWGPVDLVVLGQEDLGLFLVLGLVVPDLAWVPDQGVLALVLLPVQEGPESVSGVLPAVVPSDLALAVGLFLVASLPAWIQMEQVSPPPLRHQKVQTLGC